MENIPEQYTGIEKNVEEKKDFADEVIASRNFETCKKKLMAVNHWKAIADNMSASFRLTDNEGNDVDRLPQPGDHFRINIPASGSESRLDWVVVEEVNESGSTEGPTESASIRVRPCNDPSQKKDDTKHFFSSSATSTFRIHRELKTITAGVYSRNEKPNIAETDSVGEKIRNTAVAIGAMLGFADLQWHSLLRGILDLR